MRIFQVLHDSHGQRPEGGQGWARVEEDNCAGVLIPKSSIRCLQINISALMLKVCTNLILKDTQLIQ